MFVIVGRHADIDYEEITEGADRSLQPRQNHRRSNQNAQGARATISPEYSELDRSRARLSELIAMQVRPQGESIRKGVPERDKFPLSKKGRRQRWEMANALVAMQRELPRKIIICHSNTDRTKETADALKQVLTRTADKDVTMVPMEELREVKKGFAQKYSRDKVESLIERLHKAEHMGNLKSMSTKDIYDARALDKFMQERKSKGRYKARYPQGESPEDIFKNCEKAIELMEASYPKGRTSKGEEVAVIFMTHGLNAGFLQTLLCGKKEPEKVHDKPEAPFGSMRLFKGKDWRRMVDLGYIATHQKSEESGPPNRKKSPHEGSHAERERMRKRQAIRQRNKN